jgi:hypothetical protein
VPMNDGRFVEAIVEANTDPLPASHPEGGAEIAGPRQERLRRANQELPVESPDLGGLAAGWIQPSLSRAGAKSDLDRVRRRVGGAGRGGGQRQT